MLNNIQYRKCRQSLTQMQKEVYRKAFLLKGIQICYKVLVSLCSEIQFSEGLIGNKDLRKADACCMPEKFILYNANKIRMAF